MRKNGVLVGVIAVTDNVVAFPSTAPVSVSAGDNLTFTIDSTVNLTLLTLTILAQLN